MLSTLCYKFCTGSSPLYFVELLSVDTPAPNLRLLILSISPTKSTDNVCSPVLPDWEALSPNTFSILIQEQYSNARLKHICSKKILDLIKNTVSSFVGYSICLDETIHTGDSHVTMDYPREKISLAFCFACSKAITVSGTNSNKFIDFSETQMATGCL